MAKIVKPDRTYTVEFRQQTKWDKGIPRDGIVVHYTLPSNPKQAFIISASNDASGDREANADWQPGQTFADKSRDIKIRIDGIYSEFSTAKVTIGNSSLFELPVEIKTNRLTTACNSHGQSTHF